MELNDLIRTLRRFWALAVGVFALWLVAGLAVAFLPDERYESTATLMAEPADGEADFDSVDAVRFLLPAFVAQASTSTFERSTRERLHSDLEDVNGSIEAELEPGTSILRVRAQSTNRAAAPALANAAAQELVSRRVSRAVDVSVLDPAVEATSVTAALRLPVLAAAVVLGLVSAVFAALAARSLRRRLGESYDFAANYGLEVLGEIPARRRFPRSAAEVFSRHDQWRVSEAYQRLATNIEVALVSKRFSVLAVTSAANGEGKSSVASSLAWVLASLGHKVVAIDADYRRPTLHERFDLDRRLGVEPVPGSRRVLARSTALPSLRVVPVGHSDRHPAQLVTSELPRLLAAFKDQLTIVDTPPILGAAESTLIAMAAKTTLLVVDPRRRDPAELERALHELRRADVDILGVVLNRARVSRRVSGIESYYVPLRTISAARRPRASTTARSRKAETGSS